ncbi:MAG: DUF2344 domain-containing protein [Moorella humiferrea]|uniref:TIGR03936 family radical SAM-associated protein n=1 Tax=Neomoorella humiferrea TaxID=676965 RepID=UPI0019FBAEA7|nr:DUF2344 domain-containing protein [Moorella humiferrea]
MRFRIKYRKGGWTVYLGHLEMLRLWQRAMRRAGLPLAYSRGFNPHPRLSFGPALAVGIEGLAEYLDVELAEPLSGEEIKERLGAELPVGLELILVLSVPEGAPALTSVINAAAYRVSWDEPKDAETIRERVSALLAAPVIEVVRSSKEGTGVKDIRPGVYRLDVLDNGFLDMLLECSAKGVVRPEEVLQALALEGTYRLTRTGLFIRQNGRLLTPEEFVEPPSPARVRHRSAVTRR